MMYGLLLLIIAIRVPPFPIFSLCLLGFYTARLGQGRAGMGSL